MPRSGWHAKHSFTARLELRFSSISCSLRPLSRTNHGTGQWSHPTERDPVEPGQTPKHSHTLAFERQVAVVFVIGIHT